MEIKFVLKIGEFNIFLLTKNISHGGKRSSLFELFIVYSNKIENRVILKNQ